MIICDVIRYIEKMAPISLAMDWDNPGLMVGHTERKIKSIVVCLDVTKEIVDFTIENKANLIISHHPFIFKGIKSINVLDYKGSLIEKIIKNDICVYAAHTNFDFAQNGLNNYLARKLDLHYDNSLFLGNDKERVVGKIGELGSAMVFSDFISDLKSKLKLQSVRVVGDLDKIINKVAVFCGAFDQSLLKVVAKRVDCIVTGDLKHHVALDILQSGVNAVDASHFGTEYIFVEYVKNLLEQEFQGVKVLNLENEKDLLVCM